MSTSTTPASRSSSTARQAASCLFFVLLALCAAGLFFVRPVLAVQTTQAAQASAAKQAADKAAHKAQNDRETSLLTNQEANSLLGDPTNWLHESIRRSSTREIYAALNAGGELTEECLWLAAIHTDAATLDFLLKRMNVSPTRTFSIGRKARTGQNASYLGLNLRRRIISLFCQGRQDVKTLTNVSLLHFAALVGNTETARYLLDHGISVNVTMNNGATPVTVAYSSWLRTWNPMHVAMGAFTSISRKTNYPGFIYGLLDVGASPAPMEQIVEATKDNMERYVIGLTSDFTVPTTHGTYEPLGKILDHQSTNTAWGLLEIHVFDQDLPNYCHIVVLFLGKLKRDGKSFAIPFVFLDDRFVMPGDVSVGEQFNVWLEGHSCTRQESLDFMKNLGIDLDKASFWSNIEARFK